MHGTSTPMSFKIPAVKPGDAEKRDKISSIAFNLSDEHRRAHSHNTELLRVAHAKAKATKEAVEKPCLESGPPLMGAEDKMLFWGTVTTDPNNIRIVNTAG